MSSTHVYSTKRRSRLASSAWTRWSRVIASGRISSTVDRSTQTTCKSSVPWTRTVWSRRTISAQSLIRHFANRMREKRRNRSRSWSLCKRNSRSRVTSRASLTRWLKSWPRGRLAGVSVRCPVLIQLLKCSISLSSSKKMKGSQITHPPGQSTRRIKCFSWVTLPKS